MRCCIWNPEVPASELSDGRVRRWTPVSAGMTRVFGDGGHRSSMWVDQANWQFNV